MPRHARRRVQRITQRYAEPLESRQMLTRLLDLDLDGDLDVLRGSSWYENHDGAGNFQEHFLTASTDTDSVAVDLDNDGDLDVVSSEARWYENLGDGRFDSGTVLSDQLPDVASIRLSDVGGDDDFDIVFRSESHELFYFENIFSPDIGRADFVIRDIAEPPDGFHDFADVDQDGDLDFYVIERDDLDEALREVPPDELIVSRVTLYQNDGNGTYQRDTVMEEVVPAADWVPLVEEFGRGLLEDEIRQSYLPLERIQTLDMDGDGFEDLVLFGSDYGRTVYWMRNEQGHFETGRQMLAIPQDSGSVHLWDIDRDLDVDILIDDSITSSVDVKFNEDGEFRSGPNLAGHYDFNSIADAGDIDRDGLFDLVSPSLLDDAPWWGLEPRFNQLGEVSMSDAIDMMQDALRRNDRPFQFDYFRDGIVDTKDLQHLVEVNLRTHFGDANLDQRFDTSDLTHVFQAGEYEDGVIGNSTWNEGDFDGDGEFSSSDLVLAFQGSGYEQDDDRLLVMLNNEATLTQFDPVTGEFLGNLLQLSEEFADLQARHQVSFGPDGLIYVVARAPGQIVTQLNRYRSDGTLLDSSAFSSSWGRVYFGPDGMLYFATQFEIERFRPDDDGLDQLAPYLSAEDGIHGPTLAFGGEGYLYVASFVSNNSSSRRLRRYELATGVPDPSFEIELNGGGGLRMEFGPDGMLYNLSSSGLQRYDVVAGQLVDDDVLNGLAQVRDFAFGRDGEIFVRSHDSRDGFLVRLTRHDLVTGRILSTVTGLRRDAEGNTPSGEMFFWPATRPAV